MQIIDQLQKIADEMCDKYCKYPEQYESQYDDTDEAWDKMMCEVCDNCPLNKL